VTSQQNALASPKRNEPLCLNHCVDTKICSMAL
jgi:hypothetical protein